MTLTPNVRSIRENVRSCDSLWKNGIEFMTNVYIYWSYLWLKRCIYWMLEFVYMWITKIWSLKCNGFDRNALNIKRKRSPIEINSNLKYSVLVPRRHLLEGSDHVEHHIHRMHMSVARIDFLLYICNEKLCQLIKTVEISHILNSSEQLANSQRINEMKLMNEWLVGASSMNYNEWNGSI